MDGDSGLKRTGYRILSPEHSCRAPRNFIPTVERVDVLGHNATFGRLQGFWYQRQMYSHVMMSKDFCTKICLDMFPLGIARAALKLFSECKNLAISSP